MSGAWVAPNATVVGEVTLGEKSSVWYGAVLRGDCGKITVGAGSNIQDGCIMHEETTIGEYTTIGHGAIVHGCTIGDRCMVGMGAIVLTGAVIGDDCLIGAGALVTGKTVAPAGSLLLGNPAKIIKPVTPEQKEEILADAQLYIRLSQENLANR